MIPVRITAVRKADHRDLQRKYELPQKCPCPVAEGDVFLSLEGTRPEGFCEEAWKTIEPFVREIAAGGGGFYGDWMRDPRTAMVSCNDGFRPVSFYLEPAGESKD